MNAREEWLAAVGSMKTWKRGSIRAVHKPLLTLLLLAKAEAGMDSVTSFESIQGPLSRLLREFGPTRHSYHPEFPFWHLQSDGFWVVENAANIPIKRKGRSVSPSDLLRCQASGLVPQHLWREVRSNRELIWELSNRILDEFWPETIHNAIRAAVGLELVPPDVGADNCTNRDPRFREEVMRAYERRCAVCGYDGRLNDLPLGLEAAHIQWRAYSGPDTVENGLALCSFHHIALDAGALGLAEDGSILVSADVTGGDLVGDMLIRFAGVALRLPQPSYPTPAICHVIWHKQQVFQAPPRQPASGADEKR